MLFTDAEPASDDALLGLVHQLCPRFVPGAVLHRSTTSFVVLVAATFRGWLSGSLPLRYSA